MVGRACVGEVGRGPLVEEDELLQLVGRQPPDAAARARDERRQPIPRRLVGGEKGVDVHVSAPLRAFMATQAEHLAGVAMRIVRPAVPLLR